MDTQGQQNVRSTGAAFLHGTATVQFRPDRKTASHLPDVQLCNHRHGKGKTVKKFFGKYFSCCINKSSSHSVEQMPALVSIESRPDNGDDIRKRKQEHRRDQYILAVIAGRQNHAFDRNSVTCEFYPKGVNSTIRNEDSTSSNEAGNSDRGETGLQHQVGHSVLSPPAAAGPLNDQPDVETETASQTMTKSSFRHQDNMNDLVPYVFETSHSVSDSVTNTGGSQSSHRKTVGADPNETFGSLTESENVKIVVQGISEDMNQLVQHQGTTLPSRHPLRERSLHTFRSKKALAHLCGFRYLSPQRLLTQMMTDHSDFCYPRYSEREARISTLRNCTDVQLCGYNRAALVNAGWFFNRRTLITFCCGMEMPSSPNGHPDDIHFGLSPQCPVSLRLHSFSAETNGSENQATERPREVAQASGGVVEFKFSTPVQVSDDGCQSPSVSAEQYEFGATGFFPGGLHQAQESEPGEQWVTDGVDASVPQASNLSYTENLVTNRALLASEQWHPNSANQGQPAQQRPAVAASGAHLGMTGRMLLRSNAQNPLGIEDPDADQRNPPFHSVMDQLNFDIDRDEDHHGRYPQFGFPSVRALTFEGWPSGHTQTPSMLADAGFFYAGYGDSVLCYSCGIGVRHWLPMDDAWIEHARWRPTCVFVQTMQGQHFIDAAQEMTRNSRHPSYQEVRLEANRRRSAAETGLITNGQEGTVSGDENAAPNMMCKVCYAEEMCVVLMPCRHMAVCARCRSHIISCPICRCDVESSYQASFD